MVIDGVMLINPLQQESFSLWNAKKWIKAVTKGDSILFIHKINVSNIIEVAILHKRCFRKNLDGLGSS